MNHFYQFKRRYLYKNRQRSGSTIKVYIRPTPIGGRHCWWGQSNSLPAQEMVAFAVFGLWAHFNLASATKAVLCKVRQDSGAESQEFIWQLTTFIC